MILDNLIECIHYLMSNDDEDPGFKALIPLDFNGDGKRELITNSTFPVPFIARNR